MGSHASEMPADPRELRWLREVYQPDAPQLTLRAVVTGMALGGVLCLSNLYVVLKTGWSLGVTLTSSLLAFGLFRVLGALRLTRRDFSALENNLTATVASAAAFMTGGGNMAALPALLILTGARPGGIAMFLWFAAIAALGVLAAIPIKRQIINVEQLPFPSSVATAETIRSMHAAQAGGGGEAARRGPRLLMGGALFAAIVTFLRDARARFLPFHVPGQIPLPFTLAGHPAASFSIGLDVSLVVLGGGALMGFRTAWSMLLGAAIGYGVLAPAMLARGVIRAAEYKAIVAFTLWPGAGLLVSSGLLSFVLGFRTIARSVQGLVDGLRRRAPEADADDPLATVEAPRWWFPAGVILLAPVIVVLMRVLFGIPPWAGLLSIPLALVMAVVAARVNGETDISPTKAIGPATQLVFGVALPGDVTANVMSANVTGGVGLHAADLLADQKSGFLLGASPRKQVVAQLFGVLVGAAVVAPAFALLVPSAEALGGERFPAPAVMVWAGVSKVLAGGVAGLPLEARIAGLCGLVLGAVLTLVERRASPRWKPYVPSASGLGIALVVPGSNAVSMFTGALFALWLRRRRPELAERALVPVASGLIAGESVLGVSIALARALGWG